jgi:RNA polymerase sigma-70 factor, ECF subfamily
MSDEELAKKAMGGDTACYEELVTRYESPLLRYAVFLIQDFDAAEDCVQDTFIKTYQNLRSFNPKLKFSSWIYRIAHNTAMDYLKKRKPVRLSERILENISAQESGVAARIDKDISARDVNRCLLKLETKYREPLALYYFQDKQYRDISEVLRLPVSTVGVRISRAKTLLKAICITMGVKT